MNAEWVEELLAGKPDKAPAVVFADGKIDYGQLRKDVGDWDRRLRDAGLQRTDGVAIQMAPSANYVSLILAVLRSGAQAQLLDYRLPPAERRRYLRDLRPMVTITTAEPRGPARFELARAVQIATADERVAASEHALVQFSSGSTGDPKVIGRHGTSLVRELESFGAVAGWVESSDVALVLNSPKHSFGLIGGILHGLRVGATLAFAATAVPRDLHAALVHLRPTVVSGVPTHFDLLAALPPGSLAGVRACVSGGEVMSAATYERFGERHRLVPGQSYGLTEVGVVAMDVAGATAPAVGPLVHGQRVEIVDEEVTVLVAESPYLTAAGGERVQAGRLHTGDRGTLTDGVLRILGRRDSVVVIGGLKVELTEVESVLRMAPGVDEVVVFSRGGAVEANVGSRAGVAAAVLHAWCAEHLASYKCPRQIQVSPALPRTATGKLIRRSEPLADAHVDAEQ